MASQEIDPRAAIQEFLPAAEAIPHDQILPFRLDVDLANANIQSAMPVVTRHAATIPTDLPGINVLALKSLPALGVALTHAALAAERVAPSNASVKGYLAEASKLRRLLLTSLGALATAELVPQHDYDEIARGTGTRDLADDCVALPAVFAKYKQAITGKHPVTPEQIDRCAVVGGWLTQNLRPTDANAGNIKSLPPEVIMRNRLATLLTRRYEDLRKVAFYYYGRNANQHVPPLQSRRRRKSRDTGSDDSQP